MVGAGIESPLRGQQEELTGVQTRQRQVTGLGVRVGTHPGAAGPPAGVGDGKAWLGARCSFRGTRHPQTRARAGQG